MESRKNDISTALELFQQENMLGHYKLDEVSLVMPDGIEFEKVELMLAGLKIVSDSIRFWLGDLLVYSERNYGEKYSQLVDATDYSYQGLCDMMWVANAIAPNVRRKELTWSHHREVAKLSGDRQAEYLKIAVDKQMSVADLHSLIDEKEKVKKEKRLAKAQAYEQALKEISLIEIRDESESSFNKEALIEVVEISTTVLEEYRK